MNGRYIILVHVGIGIGLKKPCLPISICCSGVTDGREEGRFDSPDQLMQKPGPHLAQISVLVIF